MVDTLYPDLKAVARTKSDVAIYFGNGHAAWEASLSNVLSRGDKVLALATGRFGEGWAETARGLHAEVELLDFGRHDTVDPERIEAALRQDTGHKIKAVLAVHTDTATTVRNDIHVIRKAMDAAGHQALLMADCIASLGCDPFEMDAWGVDVMVAASQKGLMLPPGLCFVWFNEKAHAAHQTADMVTPYWNWTPRTRGTMFFQKFCGTAPTHHLYGLREALNMLLHEEGIEAAWKRHETIAKAVWAALDKWGENGPIAMNIPDPAIRSNAVTSVRIGAPDGTRLRRFTEKELGVTLGIGLGMETAADPKSDGYFRIAHMGHVNAHMTMGVLGAIEAGLTALQIPHGRDALSAAAAVMAGG